MDWSQTDMLLVTCRYFKDYRWIGHRLICYLSHVDTLRLTDAQSLK